MGINRSGRIMLTAAVNRLTATVTGARHGHKAMVNRGQFRGLMAVADTFARCGKGKTPATVILSAVVHAFRPLAA